MGTKRDEALGVAFVLANGGRLPAGTAKRLRKAARRDRLEAAEGERKRTRAKDYTEQPALMTGVLYPKYTARRGGLFGAGDDEEGR